MHACDACTLSCSEDKQQAMSSSSMRGQAGRGGTHTTGILTLLHTDVYLPPPPPRPLRPSFRQASRSSKAGAASSSGSSSGDSSSDDDDSDDTSSIGSFGGSKGSSLEKPSVQVLRVAKVLAGQDAKAKNQIAAEVKGLGFATHLVGEGGAGYEWPQADLGFDVAFFSVAPPPMR